MLIYVRFYLVTILATAALLLSGCSLTNKMWQVQYEVLVPTELSSASVDSFGNLNVILVYSDGGQRCFKYTATWLEENNWRDGSFAQNGPASHALIFASPYELGIKGSSIWYRTDEFEGSINCMRSEVDWSSPSPYLAIIATPFTLVIDIITAPVNVLWILMTAGGHGDPLIPWFDPHSH